MEISDCRIYEEFASQLCEWGANGRIPAAGNQDISYGLELQSKRLDKYHAKIEYRLKQRGNEKGPISSAVFSDARYTNTLAWRAYGREMDYYRDGRKSLTIKDHSLLYTIITRLNHSDVQAVCTCPNCGAVSDVSALLGGCPYCHTKFIMSDLFPKVTNFYFLPDYHLGEKEANHKIALWMISGGAIGFLLRLPELITGAVQGENLFVLFFLALLSAGVCAVFGYFALSLSLFARVLSDGVKQAPRAAGQMGAKKQLTALLKQYDSGFTYEYFIGKVQALLKILIFSDDWNGLAVYDGSAETPDFGNIIDAQFDGAIGLNGHRTEGNYCYLDLNVYMTEVYCQGDGLRRKADTFRIGLCRNISRPEDYGFSIRQAGCKSCGASFDATRERFCPYCRSRYDLKEDDWVITFVKKN